MLGFHCEQRVHAVTRSTARRANPLTQERHTINRTTETLEEEIKFACARGADSLRMMRMSVAHALHAVEDSIERFDGTGDLKTQAECINLAMMRICNDLLPKLRLDTAADAQATLLLAYALRAAA